MTSKVARALGVFTMGAAAIGTTIAFAGTASAATTDYKPVAGHVTVVKAGQSGPDVTLHAVYKRGQATPLHVSNWQTTVNDGYHWNANVTVDSGRSGAYTKCSDGSVRYGPAVGAGNWYWGGNCDGAGSITEFGNYDQ